MKKILYIDMDNVIVDFPSAFSNIDIDILNKFRNREDEIPNIFSLMKPMKNVIDSIKFLSKHFDIYVLSTASWLNPTAWSDKLLWIHKYFGNGENSILYKRLILSHHKELNNGAYIIDDRTKNGVDRFNGEHIHFGTNKFKDWKTIIEYLIKKENIQK